MSSISRAGVMAKRAVYTVGVLMVREDQGYLMTTGLIAQSEEDAIEKGVAWAERSYPLSEGYFVSHIAVANICETSIISEISAELRRGRYLQSSGMAHAVATSASPASGAKQAG